MEARRAKLRRKLNFGGGAHGSSFFLYLFVFLPAGYVKVSLLRGSQKQKKIRHFLEKKPVVLDTNQSSVGERLIFFNHYSKI